MCDVLILGNGISRLSYSAIINGWPGQVWGCNRVYLDFPHKLNRLTGHFDVMEQAKEYRELHQYKYEIWGGHLGNGSLYDNKFDCPPQFRKDSGITLVAQALHEVENVTVCGFDLGGPDIYSPGIENQLKHNWVQRWRSIFEVYDHRRVTFIGYNHKDYILSNRSSMQYAQRYRAGKPHVMDSDYLEAWKKWTGKDYISLGGFTVKVRYKKDGYVGEVSEGVAGKLIDKGKAELVKEPKIKEEPEKKEEPKKQAVKK